MATSAARCRCSSSTPAASVGHLHSADVELADPYDAYVVPAKVFALIAYKLLKGTADRPGPLWRALRPC